MLEFMNGLVPANTSPELLRALRITGIPENAPPGALLNLVNTGMIESLERDSGGATLKLMNYTSAVHLFVQWHLKPPVLSSHRLCFEWQAVEPVDAAIQAAVKAGATRNVYIPELPSSETPESLRESMSQYGEIESIRFKGKVAFVHFLSVAAAVSAVSRLKHWNAAYGLDRCAHITKHQKHLIGLYLGQPKVTLDHATLTITMAQMATAAMAVAASVGDNNVGNRTIYLTGLARDTSLEQVCLVAARGGAVQNVRIFRGAALVTFVDPIAAAQFYATWRVCPLEMNGARVRVEYGRPSPAFDKSLASIDDKVTRNIYVGDLKPGFDRAALARAMGEIGTVAHIHWVPESKCAFVNFADMDESRRAYRFLRNSPDYRHLPVRYARDRISAPSRAEQAYRGPFMLQYLSTRTR